jgi:predicted Zn-dependent protease
MASAFVVACESPTIPPRTVADIYDFRIHTDTAHVFRWPSGSQVRVFVFEGANASRAQMLATAFERGAATWNAQAIFGEYELVRATSFEDADVVLRYSDETGGVNADACPPVFQNGVTTFCLEDPTAATLRLKSFSPLPPRDTTADNIKVLVTILASQSSIAGRIDRLVVHELGHVLGIAQHSPDPDDLMASGIPVRSTLSARDAATIQVLYHTAPDIFP